ncbi:ABC transporter permease [Dictyobacter aurantiacus]|uniref:ABC transporter permease n=1 Tax=Dictyobacter aurantiacus TaxID=1936993 RepID=A0A401ZH88_9CHLR|nr:ABC transporter permease [Dictyobacter aurantiacus]GCE06254.1 ABC transporter permease [Dictyobacter aurantiacus]
MTFMALLIKEMRLRMRRERTIWLVVSYILLLGLLGWFYISVSSNNAVYGNNWASIGLGLYSILLTVQLLLIIFITPAFTSTAVNGEKERQTFDLLLCSRLSSTSLVTGKLLAGLLNALILIAASIPIFSLVFFFGGVSPTQALAALLIFVLTAVLTASLGLFCSTLVARPAISTALSYVLLLLWLGMPVLFAIIVPVRTSRMPAYLLWHPVVAMFSTYNYGSVNTNNTISIGPFNLVAWQVYSIYSVIAALILIGLSLWLVKPQAWQRLQLRLRKNNIETPGSEPKASATA